MFPGNISGNEELTLSNEINLMISLDMNNLGLIEPSVRHG